MSDDEAGQVAEIRLEHLCLGEMRLIPSAAGKQAWLAPGIEDALLRQAVLSPQVADLRLAA